MTLPMDFTNARIILPAVWSTVWVHGERGTVVRVDEDYAQPMLRVLFSDGRIGIHKLTEMGR